MRHTLVLGGVRSGKSALAETLVTAGGRRVCYIATATAEDAEMAARIRAHRARRPSSWGLVEEPLALGGVLDQQAGASPNLLVDCMSLWLGNLLAAGEGPLARERTAFLEALVRYPGNVVIVSNEVGLGIIGMDPLTRRFADELGRLNQDLAAHCDTVVISIAGIPQCLKGSLPMLRA